jgi:dienelactone hydrolase
MKTTEKDIKIRLTDNIYSFGTLVDTASTDCIVILIHGFTGHKDEHIFFNTAKYLASKGIASFRCNLYSDQSESRKFVDTKISQHGSDMTAIYKYFTKKYKKLFVIGHSFGGTSILCSDTSTLAGTIFWDASYIEKNSIHQDAARYDAKTKLYICDGNVPIIVGKDFVTELQKFPDCGVLVSKIVVPKLFITAGEKGEGNKEGGKKYMKHAVGDKTLINIPNAGHCFNNFEHEAVLITETYNWIKR